MGRRAEHGRARFHRRRFIAAAGAWSALALGQQRPNVSRIGFLGITTAEESANRVEALRAGLRELGYVESKNIVVELRWADGKYERLPALAAELVRLRVDVLVGQGAPGSLALKDATTTTPIVMGNAGEPIETGLVASLGDQPQYRSGPRAHDPAIAADQR